MIKRREKELLNIDVDKIDRINVHKEILLKKPMLMEVFDENFRDMANLADKFFNADGLKIELGSGAVSMKSSIKDVITSDVVYSKHNDCVIDAQNMDIQDDSVAMFFAQNVFHHFNDPVKFFDELKRVLRPGGGVVLIEPYYGVLASYIYKNHIPGETFNKKQSKWTSDHDGPMAGANQALSYIVFKRDIKEFERLYPEFEITHTQIQNNYVRYIISGGLNFHKLMPDVLNPFFKGLEKLLGQFKSFFGLHYIIVLKRIK